MKNEKTSPRIASIAAKMMARLIGTPKSRHGEDVIFWNGEEWICIGTVRQVESVLGSVLTQAADRKKAGKK